MGMIQISLAVIALFALGIFSWKRPRLSSIIFWSLISSIFITAAGLLILPGPFAEKARWIALSVPIIWVGIQYWCYSADNEEAVLLALISASIVGGSIVVSVNPTM
ncbi:MAG: hypothetical protein ACI9WS_002367 [Paraglaciecola psychrophila]|jgi:hypothetical protein